MSVMVKLARKYGKSSKSKSGLILLAIILSTCLITTIVTFAVSIREMNLNNVIDSYGKAEARFTNVNEKQIGMLKHHIQLEEAGVFSNVADVTDTNNYSLSLLYADEEGADLLSLKVVEGIFPQKDNEIAVLPSVLERFELPVELGHNITMEYSIGNGDSYNGKFKVVGILKENNMMALNKTGLGLISENFMNKIDPQLVHKDIALKLKDDSDVYNKILKMSMDLEIADENISFNEMLLNEKRKNITNMIPFAILGLMVIIATIIVIYNIYYISVVERIQQIGMLSSLGTSPKQLRKMIIYEGIISSMKGIPLGILLGYLISNILVPMIPLSNNIEMVFPLYIILIAAGVSLFTIRLALVKPSKIASKISPIEALRYSQVSTTGKKTTKKIKHTRLGAVGKMAYLNLWRNKKRTIMTMLSLTMSGILFITFSSIFNSMRIDNLTSNYVAGDFDIVNTDSGKDNIDDMNNIIEQVMEMKDVKNIVKTRHKIVTMEYDSEKMDEHKEQYGNYDGTVNCDVYGYEDVTLKKLADNILDGNLDLDKLNQGKYVIYSGDKDEDNYHTGDKVLFNVNKGDDTNFAEEFTVLAITDILPISNNRHSIGPTWIAHEKIVKKYLGENNYKKISVNVNENSEEEVKTELDALLANYDDVEVAEYKSLFDEYNRQKNSMKFIGMVLVFVIGLIGLLNLINTMITSILTRKKELGMLQAIGLSDKQLNTMLQVEGMYYSLISGVFASIFGIRIAKVCFEVFSKEATYAKWQSPIKEIILMLVVLIIIQYILTYFITKKLNKESIIDRIIRV
ncbi:ABC transporter permease [Vallitalea sp.]|jgi:putative ABC transport system permease protein|uniref:ABC transporter permease n=1 Tax=Vallitalea sp. TaxID=1882829 RepID=UPI0025EA6C9C|nr:ABC transporter permease [Vallitalea sp.]MCT4688088.1 FtsX-like permease family protein [Vallitalea sp.]